MGTAAALHSALFIKKKHSALFMPRHNGEGVTSDDDRNEINWTRRTGCVREREKGNWAHGWFRSIYCCCIL